MISAILKPDEKDILKKMIGKNFISYECEDPCNFSVIYGNIRLNFDDKSLEITNHAYVYPFFDTKEEITRFSVKVVNPSNEFEPEVITEAHKFWVNEKVKSIEIIKDEINVNHGEYEITFDMAIIFKLENSIFMLSRDIWFSWDINISKNDDIDSIIPIDKVIETFSNEDEYDVVVRRKKKILG